MRILSAILLLALTAACGVDGAPKPPQATAPGVSITGEASVGIVKS